MKTQKTNTVAGSQHEHSPGEMVKSLHCLMNCSETVREQWTVRFIPAGSEATSRQQEGAWPKQPSKEMTL